MEVWSIREHVRISLKNTETSWGTSCLWFHAMTAKLQTQFFLFFRLDWPFRKMKWNLGSFYLDVLHTIGCLRLSTSLFFPSLFFLGGGESEETFASTRLRPLTNTSNMPRTASWPPVSSVRMCWSVHLPQPPALSLAAGESVPPQHLFSPRHQSTGTTQSSVNPVR